MNATKLLVKLNIFLFDNVMTSNSINICLFIKINNKINLHIMEMIARFFFNFTFPFKAFR